MGPNRSVQISKHWALMATKGKVSVLWAIERTRNLPGLSSFRANPLASGVESVEIMNVTLLQWAGLGLRQ